MAATPAGRTDHFHHRELPAEEAEAFAVLLRHIQTDETRNLELHTSLIRGATLNT